MFNRKYRLNGFGRRFLVSLCFEVSQPPRITSGLLAEDVNMDPVLVLVTILTARILLSLWQV